MVVLGKIIPIALAGLAIFFLGNAIARPAQARLTGAALTETGLGLGSSLSSIGSGLGSLLGNVGTGSAQLLNPLFSLKTLIYGDAASQSDNQVNQIANAVGSQGPVQAFVVAGAVTTQQQLNNAIVSRATL